ncbi:ABC transporter substrate-binding protein [Arcanobacterium canis]
MRKTSAIRCVSVALVLSFLLGGCAGVGERASRANGRMDIAVVAKGYASPFWATTKAGAMAAGRDLGVDVTFNGPDTESDVVRQVDQLNLAYAMKPNALVVAALDESASVVVLRQFKGKGIPVVAFDSGVPGSDIPVTTVSTDNYGSAREAAKHMVELAGGKGELAVLGTSTTSVTGRERRDGFVDYIKENAPGMKIVAIEYNESDQAKAEGQASAILQAHPHLAGMFATDDDGAVAAGQTVARSRKNVIVVGYDSGKVQQDMIRAGQIAGSVTQNPYRMGYRAVTQAVLAAKGEKMPQQIDSGFTWYDAKNIDDPAIREALYD